ncbi:hypothetical protein J5U22_01668 [Saccharolobus shibatae]|uniref:Uncharacterized protein n=1 Tax=Saccharolobus shibatae TaxID=2286 RepID=A0A8F5C189_9CREN|nr:hypothetical protein J5U22_01668 [Saccharolobus shibatae]
MNTFDKKFFIFFPIKLFIFVLIEIVSSLEYKFLYYEYYLWVGSL